MNNFGPGQPLPLSTPPRKAFPVATMILGVVTLLIVLAVLGGIKVFHAAQSGSAEATAAGNTFVDSIGRHNYPAARALMTPQVQAKTSAGDLKDLETLVEKHHGTYVAHGQPQWFIQNYNGQTSVRLTYPAQYTKSSTTISLVLLQTGKGYQVYDAHYDF